MEKRYLVIYKNISCIEKELVLAFDELGSKAPIDRVQGKLFLRLKYSNVAEIMDESYAGRLKNLPKAGRRIYSIEKDNTISMMSYTEF